MATITLHLSPALDAELRRSPQPARATSKFREFHQHLATRGLKPAPLFPDARVAGFAPIWHLAVDDQEATTAAVSLGRMQGVEACYAKPADELPSPP